MRRLYRRLLRYLCRREAVLIADQYPDLTREELIQYHDYMMINCIDSDRPSADRVLGISLATVKALEN